MTVTITVDGTDVTDKVRLDGWRVEMAANQGQVGTGRLVIDDTTGSAELAPTATEWSITESDATPTTIGGGFIGEQGIDRGPLVAGTQRQFGPVLEDWNAYLTDRVFKGPAAKRPEETDYQRINWLMGQAVMDGIDGKGQVPNTNTVTMDKTDYRGKTPLDVLDDCAESAGKNFYVYYESGTGWVMYYDKTGSTEAAFTSSLQLSGVNSDIDGSSVFGVSDVDYEIDPERIYSVLNVKWASGWVYEKNTTTSSTYRNLQKTVIKENIKKASRARAWAQRQLSKLNEPTKRLECTVSVPGSALGELRAGMRIEVKLPKQGITGFTYFRIAQATISPRSGRNGVSDVEYDVRLKMFDKLRPVNLDDTYGGGDSSGNRGTGASVPPSSTGGGGGSSDSGAGSNDDYVMDDFDRSSGSAFTVVDTAVGVSHVYSEGDTTATISLPTDWDAEVGYYVICCIHEAADSDVQAEMEAVGFTKVSAAVGSDIFARRIDGTEAATYGWTSSDFAIFFSGESVELGAATLLVSGVHETSPGSISISYSYTTSASADPDDVTPSFAGEPALALTMCRTDGSAITAGPSGYTEAGNDTGTSIDYQVDYLVIGSVGTVDPGTYTATGVEQTVTIAMRGGGVIGWGSIPDGDDVGAPHEGGNAWDTYTFGSADAYVSGGVGYMVISDDDSSAHAELTGDGTEPPGPWDDGAAFLIKWSVDVLGDTSDADGNYVQFYVAAEGFRGNIRIHLGDNVNWSYMDPDQQRGIVVSQSTSTTSDFVPKTIVADTEYYIKFDARGTRVRAKFWPAADPEPVLWDIDVARVDDTTDSSIFKVSAYGNTTSGTVTHSFYEIDYQLEAPSSSGPISEVLPPGNGASDTWVIIPWISGTLKVFVDGIQTIPLSVDRDAGTFTFDRAPDLGAVIRVEYTPE